MSTAVQNKINIDAQTSHLQLFTIPAHLSSEAKIFSDFKTLTRFFPGITPER